MQPNHTQVDTLDLLSAVWILASNDENPEISYVGLRYRLQLPVGVDERALVSAHGELFRLRIPENRLTELKTRYRGKRHLPSWLREIEVGAEREAAIERLTKDDFFRSQFRAEKDAPRSPIQIIDWGLQHIDRLRTAAAEAREEKIKMWSSVRIPLVTTLIAVIALFSSIITQYQSNKNQRELKQFEVTFRPKMEGYTQFIQAVSLSFDKAGAKDPSVLQALQNGDRAFVQLEPLLNPGVRNNIRQQYLNFEAFCMELSKSGKPNEAQIDKFIHYREDLRNALYTALFQY